METALAIAGVILAWKGIVDFGGVILEIVEDDSGHRDGLLLRLEASHFVLTDWGDYWGPDREDGKFHSFDPGRKALIARIISRLHDSRRKALERLRDYNKIPKDGGSEKSFSKLLVQVKSASKKVKDKGRWMAHDKNMLNDLVNETFELYRNLNYLTYESPKFLSSILSDVYSSSIEAVINKAEKRGEEVLRSVNSHPQPESQRLEDVPVEQILTTRSAESMTSTTQIEIFQDNIGLAFHFYGDSRVPEAISMWWNEDDPSILLLQTSDAADDETSALTCAMVYYLARCHKVIYSFPTETYGKPVEGFLEMLRSLLRSLMSLGGSSEFGSITLPPGFSTIQMDNGSNVTETGQHLIDNIAKVVLKLALNHGMRIVIIVDRMDLIEDSPELSPLITSFASALQATYHASQTSIKVLFGYKGRSTLLSSCLPDEGHCDFTDRPVQTVNIMQELAFHLHDDEDIRPDKPAMINI